MSEWLENCWQVGSMEDFRTLCAFIWMTWFDHNRRWHGEKHLSAWTFCIGHETQLLWENSSTRRRDCWWLDGFLPNWARTDAAQASTYAAGFIVRNEIGGVVLSGACPLGKCCGRNFEQQ